MDAKLSKKPERDHVDETVRANGDVNATNRRWSISFSDGFGAEVEFDERGDGSGRYDVLNYRRNRITRQYEYVKVGQWNNGLKMDEGSVIRWAGGTAEVPRSECSLPCGRGQVRHGDSHTCCWVCITCQPWQYVKDEFTCIDCDVGWWPTDDKMGCFRLREQYMDWATAYAILPVCLSLFGIGLTMVVMVTFLRHIDTPIVKASGRELSFMLLSGFLICFAMTFVLLLKPGPVVCAFQRFGVGFGFSVTYSSLFTKTNRISRIFDSASRSAKRPPFISPRSQVVISLLLIAIQVICNCIWLILEPPGTRPFHPFGKRDEIVLKCRIRDQSFLISLIYNMLLIIICTVYAVKTRKIPENFNESKFIGFTMYTTCIIWLAFIPIYFGTLNSFQIQVTTLCVSISLSAFVALLCLFTPKMYIIVFQPEKNVRRLTMNSTTYKKGPGSSIDASNSNHGK
ncbi:hypothetical protein LSH36_278g01000 [Paralvinella palmiformis]|uniref:G-protein coupled receptors family 3 profile domain-containing protein n=1 Tax=Paralvinella palmiformis TaxID=53620 RepID=A0AAD9N1U1_9ANNE|nr:hypothetical protein LSH36_278g01000 [Paralvinella palmiformis]